jgi:hypothetical protein
MTAGFRTSGGERSLALTLLRRNSLANREKYREFSEFCVPKSHSCSLNCTFCGTRNPVGPKSEQGINRGVSGNSIP